MGRIPGLAPRAMSFLEILFLANSLRCLRTFLEAAARAARRFLEGPLGFFMDGILGDDGAVELVESISEVLYLSDGE